jgi:hypothetical protein
MQNANKKKVLLYLEFFLFVILLSVFCSARQIVCADNPILFWKFEEGSGTNAQDSCNGINATLYGDMIWDNGKFGKAISFNGVNTYLDAGNIYPFNQNMPEFSFSLWVDFFNNDSIWQSIFRSGYYNPYSEFIEAIQINEGDIDYALFMGVNSIGVISIDDHKWHHIAGTFNGSSQISKLYIDGVIINEYNVAIPEITSTTSPLYFGYNFDNGFLMNGTLDDIAFFTRTLTSEEVLEFYNGTIKNITMQVSSYPYVNFNIAYQISLIPPLNATLHLTNLSGAINEYNFTDGYLTLIFSEVGNYPFNITYAGYNNLAGTFLVRVPFNITICGFKEKIGTPYENEFAYLTAEFKDSKKYYDSTLEQFITPLGFATTFKTPVFATRYTNGCGTLHLWENSSYILRLWDGQASFDTSFSAPNISQTYGTNIYLGEMKLTSNSSLFNVYLSDKDIRPYRFLFNWIFIILVAGSLIVSIFLFFAIPDKPSISLIFATIIIIGALITRGIIYLYFQ